MRNSINKMGKIVAVSAGIVLMGVIFSGCGGVSGISVAETSISVAESCSGDGIITQQSRIENERNYKEVGKCKNGLKDGVWKTYDSNDRIMQEANYTGGILNGTTKIINNRGITYKQIYKNGKIVSELYRGIFYQYEKIAIA